MPDRTGPPRGCAHASTAHQLVMSIDAQLAHATAVSPAQARYIVESCRILLFKLRCGRSRRRQFHDLRVRLRDLKALARATLRYTGRAT